MKNYIILLAVLLFVCQKESFAQSEINKYFEFKYDAVSGDSTILPRKIVTVVNGLNKITLVPNIKKFGSSAFIEIIMFVYGASKCMDKDSEVNFLFKNGERLKLLNKFSFNCENTAYLSFIVPFSEYLQEEKKEFEKLTTLQISTLRVWTSKGYVQVNFDSSNSELLRKQLSVLYQDFKN